MRAAWATESHRAPSRPLTAPRNTTTDELSTAKYAPTAFHVCFRKHGKPICTNRRCATSSVQRKNNAKNTAFLIRAPGRQHQACDLVRCSQLLRLSCGNQPATATRASSRQTACTAQRARLPAPRFLWSSWKSRVLRLAPHALGSVLCVANKAPPCHRPLPRQS